MRVTLVSTYNDRCYGLRMIASYLRGQGHDVALICFKRFMSRAIPPDETDTWRRVMAATYPPVVEPREEGDIPCPYLQESTPREWDLLLETIAAARPELVGISTATATYDVARALTERIHRELPGVRVAWGGPHPMICPEESIATADIVSIGEAEEAMAELCADPRRTDIRGLWVRRNGEVVRNPLRPLEQDLDKYPFASFGVNEFLIEDERVYPCEASNKAYFREIYMIMTQRGCPFQCTYCIHNALRGLYKGERYFRRRSVDSVLAECARRVKDFDLPGFAFFDDVFVIEPKWVAEFAAKYPRRIGVPFGGYAYPMVATDEMFGQLRRAGMTFVALGVQTGSDYVGREIYGRRYDSERIVELAWMAHRHGIEVNYEILSNCPYEREEDLRATLDLLTRMPKPLDFHVKKIVFFPRLKINALDKPRPNLPETTFDFYNLLYLISRHHVLPREQLLALADDAYLKARPAVLRDVARALARAVQERDATCAARDRAAAASPSASWRGLLGYGKRLVMRALPAPVAESLRALKRRLARSG